MNQIIRDVEAPFLKANLPQMDVGDTVKVFFKIKEGNKERTQGYEGVIIKKAGSGINHTVTVRRVFQGVGIERVFLVHSPRVEKVTVQRRGQVRRAKLYYLRARAGKATRIKEKMGGQREMSSTKADAKAAKDAQAQAQAKAQAETQTEAQSQKGLTRWPALPLLSTSRLSINLS